MPYKKRMISVTAKVNENQYARLRAAAGEKSMAEWIRQVIEFELDRKPFEEQLLAELWALRYIVLNGLPAVAGESDRTAVSAVIFALKTEADEKKADKAKALLGLTR
jgi:hypothetical protein